MKLDILIGLGAGIFAFLLVMGYNILPIGLLIAGAYFSLDFCHFASSFKKRQWGVHRHHSDRF